MQLNCKSFLGRCQPRWPKSKCERFKVNRNGWHAKAILGNRFFLNCWMQCIELIQPIRYCFILSVPYHKPKQHTLKEFLSRRSIMEQEQQIRSKPRLNSAAAIKMSGQDLVEYANKINQRIQEAEEFFQEEDDENDDEENMSAPTENKANEVNAGDDGAADKSNDIDGKSSEPIENVEGIHIEHSVVDGPEVDLMASEEITHIETEPFEDIPDRNVIELHTERTDLDDELDKMDAPPQPPQPSKRQLEIAALATISAPKLGGGSGMIIDFETNEIKPKPKSGVELLVERFVTNAIVKPKICDEQEIR